jgi:hypothetical protein
LSRKRDKPTGPVVYTLIACLLAAIGIFAVTFIRGEYGRPDFWQNLLAGFHNTLFDILLISVFIYWLNDRYEKRHEIQRQRDLLDLWRGDASAVAIKNNLASIRRLNECDVYDIDLSDCVLQGTDLRGLKLTKSNLSEAQCYGTNFTEVDLSNAILDKANLRNAFLSNAILTNAKLRGTILENAKLQNADLTGADFSGAIVPKVTWDDAIYDQTTILPIDLDRSVMKVAKAQI